MADHIKLDENGVENMDGRKGSKVIAKGYDAPILGTPVGTLNVKDLDEIAHKIVAAKGTANYEVLLQMYDGPGSGVDFNSDKPEYTIAPGWHIADNGDIVRD